MKDNSKINVMDGEWIVEGVIRQTVETGAQDEPFYVMDLGEIVKRYQWWRKLMPRVEPFYAVKCNDDKMIVRTLAALGTGFDCASRQEIDLVTGIGVDPKRIIYANTIKMSSHMRHAARSGITITTFDSSEELIKIKNIMPSVKLVLRIRCDAKVAQLSLGSKFGCDPTTEAPRLLKEASEKGLEVIGVSFHVGYGVKEFEAYARGVGHCANLFEIGKALGFEMSMVNIGGGFPGDILNTMHEVSVVVNKALKRYFPDDSVRVIAEPGQYFARAAYTLAACIFGKRQVSKNGEVHTMYYMSDGVFGSFLECILYDLHLTPLLVTPSNVKPEPSSVWGPTCNSRDCICPSILLPPLPVGAWLLFQNMGAYTRSTVTTFNGFPKPNVHYIVDLSICSILKDSKLFTQADFECGLLPPRDTIDN